MVQIWIIYWNGLARKQSKHFRDIEFNLIKNNVPDLNHYNWGGGIH